MMLPWQANMLHRLVSLLYPLQPACDRQNRQRSWVPSPHEALHAAQSDHWSHPKQQKYTQFRNNQPYLIDRERCH